MREVPLYIKIHVNMYIHYTYIYILYIHTKCMYTLTCTNTVYKVHILHYINLHIIFLVQFGGKLVSFEYDKAGQSRSVHISQVGNKMSCDYHVIQFLSPDYHVFLVSCGYQCWNCSNVTCIHFCLSCDYHMILCLSCDYHMILLLSYDYHIIQLLSCDLLLPIM